jgi:hypothetical protein
MKTINKALLASTLLVASTTASYAAIDLATVPSGVFTSGKVYGSFTTNFAFDLSEASDLSVTLTNHTHGSFLDIDSLTFSLTDGTPIDSFVVGSGTQILNSYTLAAGTGYMMSISGTATGTAGGAYTFSAIASPVPEASTLSLMMAGFGLVGLMSYRRRNSI